MDGTQADFLKRMRIVLTHETKIDHNRTFYKTFDRENWNLLRRDPSCPNRAELEAHQELQLVDKMCGGNVPTLDTAINNLCH